jgi:light-regulated signal transduction histidine kinase (bacteriophytochrome)
MKVLVIGSGGREHALVETIFRTKERAGESKYISTKGQLYRDKDGNPISMLGVCFDITGMKKGAEQNLLQLHEELLRSNKELERFAYVASHDLQEPLRMVSSYTQLLEKRYHDKLDQDAREFIRFAVDGANRMQALINGLLAYSRIHTRGRDFIQVDLQKIMEVVLMNLKVKIAERNAILQIGELPIVMADEGQMIQLLQNLVTNAIKFSKDQPKISISCEKEKSDYIITVKDQGIGISPEHFDRIFQLFHRLVSRNEYEGTGLGLAICKRIVERHGGSIWVESEPGKGSTFYFKLPQPTGKELQVSRSILHDIPLE